MTHLSSIVLYWKYLLIIERQKWVLYMWNECWISLSHSLSLSLSFHLPSTLNLTFSFFLTLTFRRSTLSCSLKSGITSTHTRLVPFFHLVFLPTPLNLAFIRPDFHWHWFMRCDVMWCDVVWCGVMWHDVTDLNAAPRSSHSNNQLHTLLTPNPFLSCFYKIIREYYLGRR